MKIDDTKYIGCLEKIADLYGRLEEAQKKLEAAEKDSMMWFRKWQELDERLEKEEAKDDGRDNA